MFVAIHPTYGPGYLRHTLRFIQTYGRELAPVYILNKRYSIWRDLVRELDRRGGRDLPLVMVDSSRSDPAEFYLRDRPVTRLPEDGRIARAGLPGEFRFVHIEGNRHSARLLANLAGVAQLEPRFQVDEYVIYDARQHRQEYLVELAA